MLSRIKVEYVSIFLSLVMVFGVFAFEVSANPQKLGIVTLKNYKFSVEKQLSNKNMKKLPDVDLDSEKIDNAKDIGRMDINQDLNKNNKNKVQTKLVNSK